MPQLDNKGDIPMGKYLLMLPLWVFLFPSIGSSAPPDWAQYGKHKPHPVVPEPATYGVILLGACIVLVIFKKNLKK